MTKYLLSEADRAALQKLLKEWKDRKGQTKGRYDNDEGHQSPEVYVAKVPKGGIPKKAYRHSDGKLCEIFKLQGSPTSKNLKAINISERAYRKVVFNVSDSDIEYTGENCFTLVFKTKFGTWVTGSPSSEISTPLSPFVMVIAEEMVNWEATGRFRPYNEANLISGPQWVIDGEDIYVEAQNWTGHPIWKGSLCELIYNQSKSFITISDSATRLIGRAIDLLDKDGKPTTTGEGGIIHVDKTIASGGYWNREDWHTTFKMQYVEARVTMGPLYPTLVDEEDGTPYSIAAISVYRSYKSFWQTSPIEPTVLALRLGWLADGIPQGDPGFSTIANAGGNVAILEVREH